MSTLRHKTATCVCLEETFLLLFLYLNPYLLPAAPLRVWKLWVRGKFVLLPKNLENVAAFSKFLCPPHPLGRNFPPPFLSVLPLLSLTVPLMIRNPTLGIKLRPASAWLKLFPCFSCHYSRIFYPQRPFLGDVFTLPVQLRPPEMGIEVDIGAVWRYWEGAFVLGG